MVPALTLGVGTSLVSWAALLRARRCLRRAFLCAACGFGSARQRPSRTGFLAPGDIEFSWKLEEDVLVRSGGSPFFPRRAEEGDRLSAPLAAVRSVS